MFCCPSCPMHTHAHPLQSITVKRLLVRSSPMNSYFPWNFHLQHFLSSQASPPNSSSALHHLSAVQEGECFPLTLTSNTFRSKENSTLGTEKVFRVPRPVQSRHHFLFRRHKEKSHKSWLQLGVEQGGQGVGKNTFKSTLTTACIKTDCPS